MKYRVRPGLVLVTICGGSFLIPTRSASETFPHIVPLSLLQIALWEGLSNSVSRDVLLLPFKVLMKKKTDEEISAFVDDKLEELYRKGVLLLFDDASEANPSA